MRTAAVLAFALSFLLPALVTARPATRAGGDSVVPPLGPFLPRKATTVAQLVRQVQADPAVRRRYARFFHRKENQIAGYLRANLRPGTIPRTARYTVFYARSTGLIYPVYQTFPRGTRVFTLPGGQPALMWAYGNPLTPYRPAVETRVILRKAPVAPAGQAARGGIVEETTPNAPREIVVPAGAPTPHAR